NSIDPEKFQYDRVCEQMLKQLRSTAKIEGYQSDSLNAEFDRLEAMLKHPLSRDLDTQRKVIADYLAREIVSRYYFTKGEIIYTLRNDNCVDSAITILSDPARYNALLRKQEK
ncbi:MAG: peptidase S41, partial [Paramuribaculum sp.]|nr:peptidase S41 [Paramuribaculum sp.]